MYSNIGRLNLSRKDSASNPFGMTHTHTHIQWRSGEKVILGEKMRRKHKRRRIIFWVGEVSFGLINLVFGF